MKIICKTSRLYLREFIKEDGYHFFHMNNDPEVLRFTGNEPFHSMDDAMNFIAQYDQYKIHGYGRWAVCHSRNHEFMGWCGLKYDESFNAVDLGFRFYRKYWNQGFATESAQACIDYGFQELGIKTLVGRAYCENQASIKVLKKCGMKFVKTLKYDNRDAELYELHYDGS